MRLIFVSGVFFSMLSCPAWAEHIDLHGYKLTFDAEFSAPIATSVDGSVATWGTVRPEWKFFDPDGQVRADTGYGNSSFLDSSSGYNPFSVEGGVLRITGINPNPSKSGYRNWASGELHTLNRFSQTYGFFEMRAQLSSSAGTWPSFWLLPLKTLHPDGGDPKQWQELDIIEQYGANPGGAYQSIHSTQTPPEGVSWGFYSEHTAIPSGYHTFGMDWQIDRIKWYFDGLLLGSKPTPTDMTGPMYILVSLARDPAKQYLTTPLDGQINYMHMDIDYIRAFSKDPASVAIEQEPVSVPDAGDPGLYGASTAKLSANSDVATARKEK
ncbi:MAG: glycoside hydrolase family 16 protein [Janthinobacterium lividum]